jgi:hypothetical protein
VSDRWTTDEVIDYLAEQGRPMEPRTWRAYAARGRAPAPTYVGRTPTWDPEDVRQWHATRRRTNPHQPK